VWLASINVQELKGTTVQRYQRSILGGIRVPAILAGPSGGKCSKVGGAPAIISRHLRVGTHQSWWGAPNRSMYQHWKGLESGSLGR
jgi:hypothetical protein